MMVGGHATPESTPCRVRLSDRRRSVARFPAPVSRIPGGRVREFRQTSRLGREDRVGVRAADVSADAELRILRESQLESRRFQLDYRLPALGPAYFASHPAPDAAPRALGRATGGSRRGRSVRLA